MAPITPRYLNPYICTLGGSSMHMNGIVLMLVLGLENEKSLSFGVTENVFMHQPSQFHCNLPQQTSVNNSLKPKLLFLHT